MPKIAIAWLKLSASAKCSVYKRDDDPYILNGISGSFTKNSINALMGQSGSGKSTLLKCLNGTGNYCLTPESRIYVTNDQKIRTVYICQDQEERIMMGLTVQQALIYSCKMKNSSKSGVNHQSITSQLMNELMINDIKDNRIESCSGGQIKRICIGLELTSFKKPNMLFIDEPTTGLDSNAAEVVIDCLKRITTNHKITTIVSIHQPNHDLLLKFDNIHVLAKGGICVYSGPPQDVKKHLNDCNIRCNENQVPIEVLIKLSSEGLQDNKVKQLCDKTIADSTIDLFHLNELKEVKNGLKATTKRFNPLDFWYLLMRFFYRNYVSNFKTFVKQIVFYLILIVGSLKIYHDDIFKEDGCFQLNIIPNKTCAKQKDEESNSSNNVTYLHIIMTFSTIIILLTIAYNYVNDMKIFVSEHRNRWYSSGCFFWSKLIVETSFTIILMMVFVCSLQYLTHQFDDQKKLFSLLFVTSMTFLCIQCMGSVMGILFYENVNLGTFFGTIVFINLLLFNNCALKIDPQMMLLSLMSEFDILYYNFHSLILIIYGMGRCPKGFKSRLLIEYGLEDEERISHKFFHRFIIYLIVLIVIEFLVFILKTTRFSLKLPKLLTKKPERRSYPIHFYDNTREEVDNNSQVSTTIKVIMISWKNLSFEVSPLIGGNTKKILENISGSFETSSLNAVMGPSGAGKTTFLKCLNGRNRRGLSEETKIYFNSERRLKSCFVVQNVSEHLLNGLTVRQTLLYASKLKNSQTIHGLDDNKNIEELMSKLLISDISDNRVENCSGGERKRIVIASELTSHIKPSLLCIDEPTSGLDSNGAEKIITLLKNISMRYEMTTIVSIHQPNSDLLYMFDNIYVLANGGVCVYSGPPKQLKRHLIESGVKCDGNQFPIEVILKVSSDENSDSVSRMAEKYTSTTGTTSTGSSSSTQLVDITNESINMTKRFVPIDFIYLLLRTMTLKYLRQWKEVLLQVFVYIGIAFTMKMIVSPDMVEPSGCLEIDFGIGCNQTLEEIRTESLLRQNLRYHLYFIISLSLITIIHSLTFCTDFKILYNESKNGWYSIGAYFWAKVIVDLIPDLISMVFFCWIISFYNSFRINITYYVVMVLVISVNQSVGQISAILFTETPILSMTFSTLFVNIFIFLGNVLVPVRKLHYSLQLLSEVSYFKLSFESMIISVYGFGRCLENEISLVLYALGISTQIFWSNVIKLFIIFVSFKFITILLLYLRINYNLKDNRNTILVTDPKYKELRMCKVTF